jgi:hypothetical protein
MRENSPASRNARMTDTVFQCHRLRVTLQRDEFVSEPVDKKAAAVDFTGPLSLLAEVAGGAVLSLSYGLGRSAIPGLKSLEYRVVVPLLTGAGSDIGRVSENWSFRFLVYRYAPFFVF